MKVLIRIHLDQNNTKQWDTFILVLILISLCWILDENGPKFCVEIVLSLLCGNTDYEMIPKKMSVHLGIG